MSSAPVVACDLDGVVWRGDEAIPSAADGIAALHRAGLRVAYVSNNSNSPVDDVVAKLDRMGVDATADDVVTSATAAAWLLSDTLDPGARVLACAGPGVREALTAAGLQPVDDGKVEAVVVGFHTSFDFHELDVASRAVREGARFIATNLDATYPVPGGLIPGAGSLVAAVATAAGSTPEVAGKPEAATVGLIHARFGSAGIVVGDRPSTDGALATALEWPFALVLSGVTAAIAPPGGEAIPDPPPPFVAADLGELAPTLITALTTG
jgi:HAD superfamily hydrolase (TIGR01450 family)